MGREGEGGEGGEGEVGRGKGGGEVESKVYNIVFHENSSPVLARKP